MHCSVNKLNINELCSVKATQSERPPYLGYLGDLMSLSSIWEWKHDSVIMIFDVLCHTLNHKSNEKPSTNWRVFAFSEPKTRPHWATQITQARGLSLWAALTEHNSPIFVDTAMHRGSDRTACEVTIFRSREMSYWTWTSNLHYFTQNLSLPEALT